MTQRPEVSKCCWAVLDMGPHSPSVSEALHLRSARSLTRVFPCVAVGLESPPLSVSEERQLAILTELPFVVPFEERVKVCALVSVDCI